MNDWIDIGNATDLAPGSVSLVEVDGDEVAVFHVGDRFYAIQDLCPHDGGTLADGEVEGFEIECPRHGARFDLRTGEVTAPPACEDIRTYSVRIHQGRLQLCNKPVAIDKPPD